jgi:hypothetical protein
MNIRLGHFLICFALASLTSSCQVVTDTGNTAGRNVYNGKGPPTIQAVEGETYLDTVTGDLYNYSSGSWVNTGDSLKGAKGDTGSSSSGSSIDPAYGTATIEQFSSNSIGNIQGSSANQSFVLTGRLYTQAGGTTPLIDVVDLVLGIYDPSGNCLLYEEAQSNIDLNTSEGAFSIQVGSNQGAAQRSGNDLGLSMSKIFANSGTQIRSSGGICTGGYTPAIFDGRKLRIMVTPQSTHVSLTLPDQVIGSQPNAVVAQTLQGLAPTGFIQSAAGVSGQAGVSLASLTTLTGGSSTDASSLHSHDSLYVKLSSGGTSSNLGSGIAYTTGSLGVGIALPTADIGLGGTIARTIQVERNSVGGSAGNNLVLLAGGAASGGTDQSGGNLILSSGMATGAGSSGIQFNTASAGPSGATDRTPNTKMTLTADGRLGVGTLTPGGQFEIDASGSAIKGQIIKGAVSQSGRLLEFQNSSGSVLSYFDATGNLTLARDPIAGLEPATKQYVDDINLSLNATITGTTSSLTLTFTPPLVNNSGNLAMPVATTSANGYLSSTDWATFNSKQASLGYIPLNRGGDSLTGALVLAADPATPLSATTKQYVDAINTNLNNVITGTTSSLTLTFTSPLVNTGGNVAMQVGSTSADGYLLATDWNTFNGKQTSLGYAPVNRAGDTVSGILRMSGSNPSLTATGNVGIGTTSPFEALNIVGATGNPSTFNSAFGIGVNPQSGGYTNLLMGLSATSGGYSWLQSIQSSGGGYGYLVLNALGGNIGIGTTIPAYTLHVVGDAGLSTGTAWTNASDIRLKDVHGDYEYGLNEVLKLHTVRFNYKKSNPLGLPNDKPMIGFIAQEVQEVIPEAVHKNKNGYLELNVDPIHWAVVNALKEFFHKWLTESSDKERRIKVLEEENALIKSYLCTKEPLATLCRQVK